MWCDERLCVLAVPTKKAFRQESKMASSWVDDFGNRFHTLETRAVRPDKSIPISIKVRVVSGCFHREHSPKAYELIDHALRKYGIAADGAVI